MKIAIIGSGITALSTAWELHKRGHQVSIHSSKRAHNATQAAGGMLSPSCEADGCAPELIELGVESCTLYPSWIQELEEYTQQTAQYQQSGTLLLALHHDHNQELQHLLGFQEKVQLSGEWLSRREIKERAPNLTRHIGGLHFAEDHHVYPRALYSTLYAAIEKSEIPFFEGTLTIHHRDEHITEVQQMDQIHIADRYVIADGAWSTESLKGILDLPMRPVKGQYLLLGPKSGTETLIHTVIRTPDVYIIPRPEGQLYLGATMEEEGFDSSQTAGATLDLLFHAFQVLPGIYEYNILEQGCGFRPAPRDNQPIIGATHIPNLWLNTGQYRHGILLAPAASRLFADALEGKRCVPEVFSATRFDSKKQSSPSRF